MNEIGIGRAPMPPVGTTLRQPEIPTHINRLEGRINDLACVLDELKKRLEPVLRERGDEKLKKETAEKAQVWTPLAAQIEHNTELIDILTEKLRDMMGALEL
jgi:predicted RNase H-like nuclease (RuvC/YqgF family)